MSGVLVVVHPDRAEAASLAATTKSWWAKRGYSVEIFDDHEPELFSGAGLAENRADDRTAEARTDDRTDEASAAAIADVDFDFAISLGGDGTMLRAVRLACPAKTPVLGVNLGRMGYLTEVEPSGMLPAYERISVGEYQVEERMTLEVTIASSAFRHQVELLALNEAIIEKVAPGHTIRVAVDISGRRFLTYAADGLLVCTPTGSTAYNLSARGPVVSPRLRSMVLTPIAPHLVFDRSLVLEPSEAITFTLLADRPATVVLDGSRMIPIAEGDTVVCRGGADSARLVTFGERDFHAVLRSRFGLTDH